MNDSYHQTMRLGCKVYGHHTQRGVGWQAAEALNQQEIRCLSQS